MIRAVMRSRLPASTRYASLLVVSKAVSNPARQVSIQVQHEQVATVDRLLAKKSTRANTPYLSLPAVGEAPDLLSNPRLRNLVVVIDPRLVAPFYKDIERHNKRLQFFKTGTEDDSNSSFYLRSYMNYRTPGQSQSDFYVKPNEGGDMESELPWESLANSLVGMLKPIGSKFNEFYTHIHPAMVGRHNPHRDRLQSGSWKVDVRYSAAPTELLILDEVDQRWYALRFPKGGSGYVIDSTLFSMFHAVRAGPRIQQSILAVLDKQGSTVQMVREAVARAAAGAPPLALDHEDSLEEFELPSDPIQLPRARAAALVSARVALNFRRCAELLRDAVVAITPEHERQALAPARARTGYGLSRVPREVIDRAIASLPHEVQGAVRKAYERNIKLTQLAAYGIPSQTEAAKRGRVETGLKRRAVVDERSVVISGGAVVDGKRFELPEYDGTVNTVFRFAWNDGDLYHANVFAASGNSNASTLAMLAEKLGGARLPYVWLTIDKDDQISGPTAAMLRERGFELRVVRVAGELDNATKRARELERRQSSKARKQQLSGTPAAKRGRMKGGKSFDDRFISVHGTATVDGESMHLAKYDGPGSEDRLFRFAWVDRDWFRGSVRATSDNPGARTLATLATKLGIRSSGIWLNVSAEDVISGSTAARLRERRFELSVVRVAGEPDNATKRLRELERRKALGIKQRRVADVRRPRSAWGFFWQDTQMQASRRLGATELKKMFGALSPQEKRVYEHKAEEDRQRFETQVPARLAPGNPFEVFSSEMGPALTRQDVGKYAGQNGAVALKRDLQEQWLRLDRSVWLEYDRKAQSLQSAAPA